MTKTPEWSIVLTRLGDEAVREYCEAHGLRVSQGRIDSCRIYEHEQPPSAADEWPDFHPRCERMPGMVKAHLFTMNRRPAVIVSQPEPSFDFGPTLLWSFARPVAVKINEWPAWYFPGKVKLIEVWASWAWEIAQLRRAAASKPTAVSRWVSEWSEATAEARGER